MHYSRTTTLAVIVALLWAARAVAALTPNGMVHVNKLTMSDVTNGGLYSAAIDPVNGYAYFGGKHFLTKVNIKSAQPVELGTIAMNSQLVTLIDVAAGYGYFGAGTKLNRFSLGVGDAPPVFVDSITLSGGVFGGVIDTSSPNIANHYLYINLSTTPNTIVKISVATFTQVQSLTLDASDTGIRRGIIDTQNGYMYFCGPFANSANPFLVKIALGAGSSIPQRIGSVQLDNLPYGMGAAVIDVAHGFGYFGVYTAAAGNSSVPHVYKVALGAGDTPPSYIGMATLYAGTGALNGPEAQELQISTGILEPTSGFAYFGSDHTYPAKIYQINLGSGNAVPAETGMLQSPGGSHALGEPNGPNDGEQFLPRTNTENIDYGEVFHQSSVLDPMRGDPSLPGSHYAYFGCDSYAGQVGKILLQPPASTFKWNGGSGAWTIGAGGWDLGNWTDVGNAVIGNGTDTGGTITIASASTVNPGAILFNPAQTGAYTLMVNGKLDMGTPVNVKSGATLRGVSGTINRVVQTDASGIVWPGAANFGSGVPANGEALTVAGLDMSAGGMVKIALNVNSASSTQELIVAGPTCTLGGTLSLGVPPGTASANAYTVLSSAGPVSGTFATIKLNGVTVSGTSPVKVLYSLNAVTVTITGAVTPVTLEAFTAKVEGAGVLLSWNAVSEFQNAGFNIYRRAMDGSEWTRVNPSMIPGRISAADLKRYTYYDWAQPGVYEYKLETVNIAGDRAAYLQYTDDVTFDGLDSKRNADSQEVVAAAALAIDARVRLLRSEAWRGQFAMNPAGQSAGKIEILKRSEVSKKADSVALPQWNAGARWFSAGGARAGSSMNLPSGFDAAKLVYSSPGVYWVPQSTLPAGFDIHRLAIQREGRNMTALTVLPDGLLLYGPGYADDYTDKDALFLRKSATATVEGRVVTAAGLFRSALPLNLTTSATVTCTFHDVYFDYTLRPLDYPPWFSDKFLSGGTARDFTVETPLPAGGASTLTINLWSLSDSDHAVQVFVNSKPIGSATWSGGNQMMQLTFDLPSRTLSDGTNTVSILTPVDDTAIGQMALLNSISVGYTKRLEGPQTMEVISENSADQLFEIRNLPPTGAWVVDTRFSDRPALVPSETQSQSDGTVRLRFIAPGGGSGRFLVVPIGQELSASSITWRQVKPAKPSAYIATGPMQFALGVQPLLAVHSKEGLRAAFVDQEQLFDYYGFGRFGPRAIQNAVRSLRPQYLLLLGRTTFDYRNYSGLNVQTLCPTFLVSTTFWSQATSDSMFGDLGRGFSETAIGRLPVNDPDELIAGVQRILSYRGASQSGVRIHAVADRADPATADFPAQAAALNQAFPAMTWQQNYLGVNAQSSSEISASLATAASGGTDWILYIGHGNSVRLGKDAPRILDTTSVQAWTGNVVLLQSTCTANWMVNNQDGFRSIAIQALVQPQGGICASVGTSTYMNSECAVEFMRQVMSTASTDGQRWGTTVMKAQQWAYLRKGDSEFYDDLNRTEQLFGDPAMLVFSNPSKSSRKSKDEPGRF